MKLIGIITLIFFSPFHLIGQPTEQINFWGYTLIEYQQPVKIGQDEYMPYFNQIEETNYLFGRIILSENSFIIKWIDGEDWVANIKKKEIINEADSFYKAFKKIIYTGIWLKDNVDCELEITLTETLGCLTVLKSKKVVDKLYKIDTYKKFFRFHSEGNCFKEAKQFVDLKKASDLKPDSTKNLNNRKLIYQEPFSVDSFGIGKGKLVFNICIDRKGKIISVVYHYHLSTVTDKELIQAIKTKLILYKYNTDENAPEIQCGNIILNIATQ